MRCIRVLLVVNRINPGFHLMDKPPNSNIGSPSIGDSLFGVPAMPVIAIMLALNAGALAAMKLATVLAF